MKFYNIVNKRKIKLHNIDNKIRVKCCKIENKITKKVISYFISDVEKLIC